MKNAAYQEFIGAQLIQPLIVGIKYFLSVYINKSNTQLCYVNNFGLRFSNVSYSLTNPAPVDNFSHCHSTTVITDTVNWVQIAGSFIADSAYQYIIIRNFYDAAHLSQLNCILPPAYYYIDNVCVSTDSLTCNSTFGVSELKNTDELILFPNSFSDKINITAKRNDLVEVNLFDVTSRKIFNQSFTNSTSLNTEQLVKGIYLYKVRNKNGVIKNGKVVKD